METAGPASTPTATSIHLNVEIPPVTCDDIAETTNQSQGTVNQKVRGELSPDPLTPTSIANLLEDDDGTHMPEDAATPEGTKILEESEQRCCERRASLADVREIEYDHQKETHKSEAP